MVVAMVLYQIIFILLAWQVFDLLNGAFPNYTTQSAIIAFAVLFVTYFGLSAAFAVVDLKHKPAWLHARKYQTDTCVTPEEYKQAYLRTLFKFVLVFLPYLMVVFWVMRARVRSSFPNVATFLSGGGFLAFLIVLFIVYLIADFSAWFIHKGLHKGVLWQWIHSVHHRYVATIAVGSLDAHPIEMVLWDAVPFSIGPLILGAPPAFFLVFAVLSILNTIMCHCGYDIGYDLGHHDLHHERLKCNYSGFLSDWIMGTYIPREKQKVYPRFDAFQKSLQDSTNEWCDTIDNKTRTRPL